MKFEVIDRDFLFNSNISINHYLLNNDANLAKAQETFLSYNQKRLRKNYSIASFENLVKENRFSYGIVELYVGNILQSFSGLCDYNNWIIFTRFISFKYFRIPFASAYLVPFVLEKAKNDDKEGLVFTFGKENTILKHGLNNENYFKYEKNFRKNILIEQKHISDHDLFVKSVQTCNLMKTLPYTVNYRYTEQHVVYIPIKNSTPPFEKYKKIGVDE